jgi:hypothetical protein
MKDFSEFHKDTVLEGDKLSMGSVIDAAIEVLGFAERASRYSKSNDGKYMIIQIRHNGRKGVIFTASEILKQQLVTYKDMLPFKAKIIYNGKYYTFKGCNDESNV